MAINISVVIPTYRRTELLRKCLTALTEQTYDNRLYEVIVVSDGYDAATEEVIRHFFHGDTQIKDLHLQTKKGPAAARNLGWKSANGILIAFTDDDTIPDKNWLSGIWNTYKGEKEIAYTGKIKVPVSNPPTDFERVTAALEGADFVTANCICTKAALERVKGFDERFSMAWREDSDLEFKLILHHIPVVRFIEAWVTHPVRKAPWGISIKEQKKSMFNALLYKKYPKLYRQRIRQQPNWHYYLMIVSFILFATAYLIHIKWLTIVSLITWLVLVLHFIQKRLMNTSHSWEHVTEMILTSLLIPFLSMYWHWYGAFKYRVLFL